jgi:hypothetical protein
VLLKTASMTRNGLLKPVKPSATRDESNQPAPNSSTEASRSSLWKQACPEGKINCKRSGGVTARGELCLC